MLCIRNRHIIFNICQSRITISFPQVQVMEQIIFDLSTSELFVCRIFNVWSLEFAFLPVKIQRYIQNNQQNRLPAFPPRNVAQSSLNCLLALPTIVSVHLTKESIVPFRFGGVEVTIFWCLPWTIGPTSSSIEDEKKMMWLNCWNWQMYHFWPWFLKYMQI